MNLTHSSPPAWRIERRGLEAVPVSERRGGVGGIFALWFAGNLAITSVVIGAVVAGNGLSLGQALLALLGVGSFLIVGYFSLPGMRTGRPTMALSGASFGSWGNVVPSALSWLNLVGWETVVLVIAAYALEAAYDAAFAVPSSQLKTASTSSFWIAHPPSTLAHRGCACLFDCDCRERALLGEYGLRLLSLPAP